MNQSTNTVAHRGSSEAVFATNKLIRNTYILLSMTLLFSAATAGVSMVANIPHPGFAVSLVVMLGLVFLIQALRNSVWGIAAVFALTGFMGLTLGPILNFYVSHFDNGTQLVMTALGGTGYGCCYNMLCTLCMICELSSKMQFFVVRFFYSHYSAPHFSPE